MPASRDSLPTSLEDLSVMVAGEDELVEHIITLLDCPFDEAAQRRAAAFLAGEQLRQANAAAARIMGQIDGNEEEVSGDAEESSAP
jgi:hypothetical protein